MKKTLLLFVFCLGTMRLLAQQDPQFSQYMFNTMYYNPAFAGVDGVTRVTGTFRSQWTGYSPTSYAGGAPTTEMFTLNTPTAKGNGGVGVSIVNDHLGPQNNLQGLVSYAYHLGFKDSKLSFGVSAGAYSQSINGSLYHPIDPNDPLLNISGTVSQVRKDFSAGLYYRKEKYYAGVSFDHLVKSTFSFGGNQRSTLQPHAYFTAGYFYEVNFDLKFQFSTLVQSDFTKTTINGTALAYLKDTMWGGLSFRQSDALVLILGYSLLKDKSLKVGYSLDYIVSNQQAKQPTSNEIMLTYELPTNPGPSKKIVRTPRYRH